MLISQAGTCSRLAASIQSRSSPSGETWTDWSRWDRTISFHHDLELTVKWTSVRTMYNGTIFWPAFWDYKHALVDRSKTDKNCHFPVKVFSTDSCRPTSNDNFWNFDQNSKWLPNSLSKNKCKKSFLGMCSMNSELFSTKRQKRWWINVILAKIWTMMFFKHRDPRWLPHDTSKPEVAISPDLVVIW